MDFLAFILGRWVYKPFSKFVRMVLLLKGVSVGKGFYAEGIPKLIIDGNASNIRIGHSVMIKSDVELKVRENGKITIGNSCKIDRGCRLLAANDAVLRIGDNTNIGPYDVFNCGADVSIGEKSLISGFSYIQSSNHKIEKGRPIKEQGYNYAPIEIGDDVWIGSQVTILPGITIKSGAVIGAGSVVTKDVEQNTVAVGNPARYLKERSVCCGNSKKGQL